MPYFIPLGANMKTYSMIDTRHGLNEPIELKLERYAENGNMALEADCISEYQGYRIREPWARFSVNLSHKLPDDLIAIKDWSENEGVAAMLAEEGLIEPFPAHSTQVGYVTAHIYRITDKFRTTFGIGD
jgi:hypothetical protein